MVPDNEMTDPLRTAFTVSVDSVQTTTGISATDRASTLRALGDSASTPATFTRPGHIFPLRARTEEGGVLARRGHTEAAVDIALAAGAGSVGMLCEVCDPHTKEMLRLPALADLAQQCHLPLISIEDMAVWRARRESLLRPQRVLASPTSATHTFRGAVTLSPEGFAAPRVSVILHLAQAPAGHGFPSRGPLPGVQAPLPVYVHAEAAGEVAVGEGAALVQQLRAMGPADAPVQGEASELSQHLVTSAVVVLHAQGGLVADFAGAAPAAPAKQEQPATLVTAYHCPAPPAVASALEGVPLPEGWTQHLPTALLHTENAQLLSTPASALAAQALGHALAEHCGVAPGTPVTVPVSSVMWRGDCLRMPVPRLWALGTPGAPQLLQQAAPAPALPGTLPEPQAPLEHGAGHDTSAPCLDIAFDVCETLSVQPDTVTRG